MAEGISDESEKLFERLFFPIVYKAAVFLAAQVFDVVARPFLPAVRPTLLV
jgi:hypothetical protein